MNRLSPLIHPELYVLKNRIAKYRLRKGFTQSYLGSLVGVSKNSISCYECGDFSPSSEVAFKLCLALGVNFETLFFLDYVDGYEV